MLSGITLCDIYKGLLYFIDYQHHLWYKAPVQPCVHMERYPHGILTSTPHLLQGTFGEKPMWATTSLIDAMRTAKKGITLSNRWCIPLMLDYYIRFGLTCQGFLFSFFTFLFSLDLCKSFVIGWVMPYVCHISMYIQSTLEYAIRIAILLTLRVIIPIYTNVVKG